jgi:translation initiation factor 2 subunit 1
MIIKIVRVLRVDEEQGYIDLSKKRVQKDEEEECLSRYANSKTVHSILRTLAEKEKINIPQLYEQVVWPLARRKEYDQPLHYFRMALEYFVLIMIGMATKLSLASKSPKSSRLS